MLVVGLVVLVSLGFVVIRHGPFERDRPGTPRQAENGFQAGRIGGGSDARSRGEDGPTPEPGSWLRPPKPGRYVYEFSSTDTSPSPATLPAKGTITQSVEVRARSFGAEVVIRTGTGSFRSVERQRWDRGRVLLTAMEAGPEGTTDVCAVEPAAVLVKLPLTDVLVRSSWANTHCSGQMDVRFLGVERVMDASGASWDAWKFSRRVAYGSGDLDATIWFAPALGLEVKSIRHMGARRQDGTVLSSTQTSLLKSHPS